MAWIESHQEVARHPKTRKLARRLEVSVPAAVGHLHLLWWWALDHAFDGDLTDWDVEDIAHAAGWDGDPEVLIKALLEARGRSGQGYLEQNGERLLIHDWDTYTAHLRARKESAQKANHIRWHEKRNVTDPDCEWCRSPDSSERIPTGTASESTLPNLTKPNQTEPKTPTPSGDGFDEFWKQYPTRINGGSKGSRKNALAVWKRLSPAKKAKALSSLPIYAKAKNGYPKDAERYLRSEEWEGLENVVSIPESEYQWL